MISNERPSPFSGDRLPPARYGGYQSGQYVKPHAPEDTLKTESIQIERKTFIFTLKENARGRLLRITEDVNGRRDNIIIPSTGLEDFRKMVNEMVKAANEIPPGKAAPPVLE